MSPVPFHQNRSSSESTRPALPPPLKIKRESHFLKKQPPSSHQHQQREPVIIYTHSPRVIETDAKSFKELVQKLTGFHRSEHHQEEDQEKDRHHRQEKSSSPPKQINVVDVALAVRSRTTDQEEMINNETTTMMMNSYNNYCIGADLKPPPCPPLPSSAIQYPPPDHFLCSNQPLWSYADHRFSSDDHHDFQPFRY